MSPALSVPPSSSGNRRKMLAAVMFADMVGYSRRMEQDEAQNSSQAARSIQLFKSLIGDYGGKVANVAGDGILALFDSSEHALRFAGLAARIACAASAMISGLRPWRGSTTIRGCADTWAPSSSRATT